jgi:putative FmdB family regulatory protein
MPTYEYQCKTCGHRFDVFHKVSDPSPKSCPECKSSPISKVFTSVGIIFKGSGFHINDYKKPGAKTSESEAKASESEASSKGETKADAAKPESDTSSETSSTPTSSTAGSTPKTEAPAAT